MGIFKTGCAVLGAAAMVLGGPASAAQDVQTAASLRRLDMMLMVTSLRCRFGADDFQAEYDQFRASHIASLRDAALQVTDELSRQYGKQGAMNQFDKMSVAMANYYGAGHPRLSCADLKAETATMARIPGEAVMVAAAGRMLDGGDKAGMLLARR
ncbi:MAG: hypothetical protein RLZZ08_1768 [Pseudomonadota bacterium]|jgi:hypothetical protein